MNKTDFKLGDTVRDTISGFQGVAIARTEWLNGCVRVTIQPQALHEGKPIESHTFDVEQLEIVLSGKQPAATPSGGDRPTIARNRDPR